MKMKKLLKVFCVLSMLTLVLTGCGAEEKEVTGTWEASYVDTTVSQMIPFEGDFVILVSLELKEDKSYVLSMSISEEVLDGLKTAITTLVNEQVVAVMEQGSMTEAEALKYLQGGEDGTTIENLIDENYDLMVSTINTQVLEGAWEQTSDGVTFDEEESSTLTWDGDALVIADFITGVSLTFNKK